MDLIWGVTRGNGRSPEARAMFDDGTLFIETVTSFVVDEQVVIGD